MMSIRQHTIGWGAAGSRINALNLPLRLKQARTRTEWTTFRSKFSKKFRNTSDEELHARIFEETEAIVAEHNEAFARGETTFTMGINQFADMTEDEYRKMTPVMDTEAFVNADWEGERTYECTNKRATFSRQLHKSCASEASAGVA